VSHSAIVLSSWKTFGRDEYLAPIPENERGDTLLAYKKLLHSTDPEVRLKAGRAWEKWELVLYIYNDEA